MTAVWRRTRGWVRAVLLAVLALLVLAGGLVGLVVTGLVLLVLLSGWIGHAITRWWSRGPARYVGDVDQTHARMEERLSWLRREIEVRDQRIAELERDRDGRTGDARA